MDNQKSHDANLNCFSTCRRRLFKCVHLVIHHKDSHTRRFSALWN